MTIPCFVVKPDGDKHTVYEVYRHGIEYKMFSFGTEQEAQEFIDNNIKTNEE